MILTFPLVNERGETNGCEITFSLQDIQSVSQMHNWDRRIRDGSDALPEVVQGCCSVDMNYHTHDIKADYNELKELFKEWNKVYR